MTTRASTQGRPEAKRRHQPALILLGLLVSVAAFALIAFYVSRALDSELLGGVAAGLAFVTAAIVCLPSAAGSHPR